MSKFEHDRDKFKADNETVELTINRYSAVCLGQLRHLNSRPFRKTLFNR